MNASNATELYYYTEFGTTDLLTFNFTVTPSVTLTPETYDSQEVLDNHGSPSTPTQGKQSLSSMLPSIAAHRDVHGSCLSMGWVVLGQEIWTHVK